MTRTEVDEQWVAFAQGRTTAADVHAWADNHLREANEVEPLALRGLQDLHGLSGRSFQGSSDAVLQRLTEWRAECPAYDRDPESWSRERIQRAMSGLRAEGKAPGHHA